MHSQAGVAPGGLRSKSGHPHPDLLHFKKASARRSPVRTSSASCRKNHSPTILRQTTRFSALTALGNNQPGRGRELQAGAAGQQRRRKPRRPAPAFRARQGRRPRRWRCSPPPRSSAENTVTTTRTENGYNVTCHISGGDMELMSLTVYVPDLYQARVRQKGISTAIPSASTTCCSPR